MDSRDTDPLENSTMPVSASTVKCLAYYSENEPNSEKQNQSKCSFTVYLFWHSIDIAAEQAALVWACAAKRWWWLGDKCMEYEVEGSRPRGRPKRTWKEVVREDCQARKLNKEDAVDRCKWRKVIKEVCWPGWVWAGECFFGTGLPGLSRTNGR